MHIVLRTISKLAVSVVGCLAALLFVGFVIVSIHRNTPQPTISPREFEMVNVGMTIEQVEAILGGRYLSETYRSGMDEAGVRVFAPGYDMLASWSNDATHSSINVSFNAGKAIKVQYSDYDYSVPGTAVTKTKP